MGDANEIRTEFAHNTDRAPVANVRVRKFPFPFRAALAVNNDTDGMTWDSFEDWHSFVNGTGSTTYGDGLGLEVGDSFWVWATNGDFALQHAAPWGGGRNDAPEFNRIKELVNLGWLDTLHGMGDWREKYQLNQDDMKRGLCILDELGGFPPVYVNHGGGQSHGHNIGGPWPSYQGGDDPNHHSYCLPELIHRGARYFWVDAHFETSKFGEELEFENSNSEAHILNDPKTNRWKLRIDRSEQPPNRIDLFKSHPEYRADIQKQFLANNLLAPLVGRDGSAFLGVKRFRGTEGPTAANFALQATVANLDSLETRQGACVIYQHFGVWRAIGRPKRHRSQTSGRLPALDENAVWAWRDIAERNAAGRLFVTTTGRLLNFMRMRDCLKFRVNSSAERTVVTIERIACPVYGDATPSIGDLNGLAFEVDHETPEFILKLKDHATALSTRRDRDPANQQIDVVYLKWSALEFPPAKGMRRVKAQQTVEPALPDGLQNAVNSKPTPLTEEQITKWINLTRIWQDLHEGREADPALRPSSYRADIQDLCRSWGKIELPSKLTRIATIVAKEQELSFGYYVNKISRWTSGGKSALSLGSGAGAWAFALLEQFDAVEGINRRQENIDAANWIVDKFDNKRIKFSTCNTPNKTPFKNDHFDFICCYNSLGEVASLQATLTELSRIVRPGGLIYAKMNGPEWLEYQRENRDKISSGAYANALNGIYKRECQRRWMNIDRKFSEFHADYTTNNSLKSSIAASLKIKASQCDALLAAVVGSNTYNGVKWPAAQPIVDERGYFRFLDSLMAAAKMGPFNFHDGAQVIEAECGPSYALSLAEDLHQQFRGRKSEFDHATRHRCFTPDEIRQILTQCQLVDFQWSIEDDSNAKASQATVDTPQPNEQSMAEWEFSCQKPH